MKAVGEDANYAKWLKNEHNYLPWTNVSIEVLQLCRQILTDDPSERIKLPDLVSCKWLMSKGVDETFSVQASKRLKLANSSAFRFFIEVLKS